MNFLNLILRGGFFCFCFLGMVGGAKKKQTAHDHNATNPVKPCEGNKAPVVSFFFNKRGHVQFFLFFNMPVTQSLQFTSNKKMVSGKDKYLRNVRDRGQT